MWGNRSQNLVFKTTNLVFGREGWVRLRKYIKREIIIQDIKREIIIQDNLYIVYIKYTQYCISQGWNLDTRDEHSRYSQLPQL